MPTRAAVPCTHPGCGHRKPCPDHGRRVRTQADRELDRRVWRRYSTWSRQQQPLCVDCLAEGRTTLATDVHHPAKRSDGGALLTGETRNLCHPHHSARTARGE